MKLWLKWLIQCNKSSNVTFNIILDFGLLLFYIYTQKNYNAVSWADKLLEVWLLWTWTSDIWVVTIPAPSSRSLLMTELILLSLLAGLIFTYLLGFLFIGFIGVVNLSDRGPESKLGKLNLLEKKWIKFKICPEFCWVLPNLTLRQ